MFAALSTLSHIARRLGRPSHRRASAVVGAQPTRRIGVRHDLIRSTVVAAAAFGTYFAMYAFRKPFAAASHAGEPCWGIELKSLYVGAQVIGYTISKFFGIAVIARMTRERRAVALVALVLAAEAALVGFGAAPPPWRALCLFANGLPLGMVFGLVLGFLEGRRHTEAMAAGLCASFIVADGATKSVGAWLLEAGVAEAWMPALAGALFLPALLGCVAVLARTPPPDAADVHCRAERLPMTRADRRAFFARHAFGLVLLVIGYLLLTVLRSLRGDFAPELLRLLGDPAEPSVFASSESLVGLGVLAVSAATVLVRDNRRAFAVAIAVAVLGFACCVVCLLLQASGRLDGFSFMVLLGLGLYVPYVVVHTTVFERLVAMTRDRGNIGYLMYLADAFGYLGYVVVLLLRGSIRSSGSLLDLFLATAWGVATAGAVCFGLAGAWFLRRKRAEGAEPALASR